MFRLRDLLHAPYRIRKARLGECAVHNKQGALCEQGASLVEMALSASVLFVLLFGIIETCMALYAYNFVSEAAREATRYAVVRGPNSCLISSTFPACNLNPLTYGNGNTSYTPSTSTTPSSWSISSLRPGASAGATSNSSAPTSRNPFANRCQRELR